MDFRKREDSCLRFATFLSPILYEVYEGISRYIGEQTGLPTRLAAGSSPEELARGQVDVGFVCGLPYSRMARRRDAPIEVLAAPVLLPERYDGEPRYFSDVVVRRDSPFASFKDLRGRVWGYNERTSHSGWNLVCSSLYRQGLGLDYFGEMRKTGSHLASLSMLERGEIDEAAIDSHVFDVARLRQPDLDARLRVVEVLGPSSIPPIVVSKTLDSSLKRAIRAALLRMHSDWQAAHVLQKGLIARFVSVGDEHYEHIYRMYCFVRQWRECTFRCMTETM
jgi:phosphonate transport system substrate-binding protein